MVTLSVNATKIATLPALHMNHICSLKWVALSDILYQMGKIYILTFSKKRPSLKVKTEKKIKGNAFNFFNEQYRGQWTQSNGAVIFARR